MATYATDLQTVTLADTDTGFSELDSHTSGSSPASTTENYFHNSAAVDQATGQAVAQSAGMEYDNGADLGVGWTAGHVFMVWQKFDAATNLYNWAGQGMLFGIGSASGDMNYWNALGDNFGNYPSGGWQNTAIDPQVTPDGLDGLGTADGTPIAGNYSVFGSLPNMRQKITKGSPHVVDAIRYGRGELQITGTGATFAGMSAADTALASKWGLFDGKEWKGLMSIGLTATSASFTDSNVSFNVVDTPRVAAGFNKIEVNHVDTVVDWTSVAINGIGTKAIDVVVSAGDFEVVANASIDKTSCTFTDVGTFTYQSNSTLLNTIYRRCGLVTQGGGVFTGCVFDSPSGNVGLRVDSLGNVTDCTFNSAGTGHGVDLGTVSADISMSWDNHESGYTTSSSGNETILVSVDSGVTLTINVQSGASTPSVYNTGLGTVNVVSGLVSFKFTVNPSITGYEYRLYSVTAIGSLAGAVELQGLESATLDTYTYTYTYTADQPIAVQLLFGDGSVNDYEEVVAFYTLGVSDQNVIINLDTDYNN